MSIRMRVLPRFPAMISGISGITTTRSGTDIIIKSDYGSLIRIPAVADANTSFFKVWDSNLDSYSIMTFGDVFAAVADMGFMDKTTYDPQNKHQDVFAYADLNLRRAGGTMSGAIAMGTNKITGLANGTSAGDAVNFGQVDGKVVYASKSGNYTALGTDNNAVHRYTATATVALTAAATLGSNWHYTVVADGAVVTIDPNGSETINGAATLSVPSGTTAEIICDGTGFYSVFRTTGWEFIRDDTVTTAATYDVTNLSAYRKLRITGFLYPSSASAISLRMSTDNGATFLSGATDYGYQYLGAQGAASSAASAAAALYPITNLASVNATVNEGCYFEIVIENFNKASQPKIRSNCGGFNGSGELLNVTTGRSSNSTAKNALRLLSGSGTLTGYVTVEGIRG